MGFGFVPDRAMSEFRNVSLGIPEKAIPDNPLFTEEHVERLKGYLDNDLNRMN